MDPALDGNGAGGLTDGEWEDLYRPLPTLFLALFLVWTALSLLWMWNTWSKRRWQSSNLQWILSLVPILKAIALGLSFDFWYTCLELGSCEFWVAFGVFVMRIFFETSCFVCFLLIAHGFCITREQLSMAERRWIMGIASLLYLSLTGYKAAVPNFGILVVIVYIVVLSIIFYKIARNLQELREELAQVETEGLQMMHPALFTKCNMFRRFQLAMVAMVLLEIVMHSNTGEAIADEYWVRLVLRELAEITIFLHIGWTFRSRGALEPFFELIPVVHANVRRKLPPIHSVNMTEEEFRTIDFNTCHIGVLNSCESQLPAPMLVIVQNPSSRSRRTSSTHNPQTHMPPYSTHSNANSTISIPLLRGQMLPGTSHPVPASILCPPATESRTLARRFSSPSSVQPLPPAAFATPPCASPSQWQPPMYAQPWGFGGSSESSSPFPRTPSLSSFTVPMKENLGLCHAAAGMRGDARRYSQDAAERTPFLRQCSMPAGPQGSLLANEASRFSHDDQRDAGRGWASGDWH